MKANKFFLGLALIGAILTGCDKGQEPETNGGEAKAYMSVRISMASTAGTRATTDGGFAVGTADEQKINASKSIFLFYDENGKWVTSGQLATSTGTGGENHTSTEGQDHYGEPDGKDINDYHESAYIVLSGPDDELQLSRKVLAVVNYSKCESLKNLDLNQALAALATDATGEDPADAGTNGFLMSTSVYYDGTNFVNTTAITGDNIKPTVAEATGKPVDIYIERAAAKADFTISTEDDFGLLTGNGGEGDKRIIVDGKLSNAKVTITGWNLNNVYKQTYVVKHLLDAWKTTAPFKGSAWNWKENHRSYWAMGQNWGGSGAGGKYVRAYKDAAGRAVDGSVVAYCYENTVETPDCDPNTPDPNVNTVLIAAKLEVPTTPTGKDWEAGKNLYEYAGVFYRETTYFELILKQIKEKGYKKSGGADYVIGDLEIKPLGGGSLAGIKFKVNNKDSQLIDGKDVEAFVNDLAYVTETKGYAGGKCYYQIPVEHLGYVDDDPKKPNYGMVRNHWYKINVSAINHVGDAVFDDTVVIPGIPEKNQEYYLSAKIHVLSWHVVKQSVEL